MDISYSLLECVAYQEDRQEWEMLWYRKDKGPQMHRFA